MEHITGAALSIFLYYMKTYNFIKAEVLNYLIPITDRYDLFDILLIWSVIVIILTTVYTRFQHARKFGLRRVLSTWFVKKLRSIDFINNQIEKNLDQIKQSIENDIAKGRDPVKTLEIPQQGISEEAIRRKAQQWSKNDYKVYGEKKITGCLYYNEGEKLTTLVKDVAKEYFYVNPLHFDLFPNAAQMEGEVIAMVKNLYNGDDAACGVLTSGGTESIMTAMLAYREWGKDRGIADPEIIAPVTAHVALEKAAFYYGMRVTYVPISLETGTCDPADVKAAISRDTVCVFGSYPNYPYGTVDPIEEMAEIARKRGIGFHSDCCLGGFVAPFAHKFGAERGAFDFRVKGVTSISVDPHKYGLAPKGVSTVLFRNRKLRLGAIFSSAIWPGGVYATPTHAGSRGLGPVAGAWVALLNVGYNGYMDKAGKLIEATRRCTKKLREIKELQVVGEPELAVVSFVMRDKRLNCYQLAEKIGHKGWKLASLQKPPGLHLAITNYNVNMVEDFLATVKIAVAEMVANPPTKKGDLAQLYGSAAVLPENIVQDGVKLIIEATLKP